MALATLLAAGCGGGSTAGSAPPDDAAVGRDATGSPKVDAGGKRQADAGGTSAGRDAAAAHESGAADAGAADARGDDAPSSADAGSDAACSVEGAAGQCMEVTACEAMAGYTSTPGYCPGPASIECCTNTPSVADNPPPPAGYVLMQQSQVTAAMTAWAVMILDDPTDYPMFSTTTMTFGTQLVLARVEWHPPDFQNSVVHRGVTLYIPD